MGGQATSSPESVNRVELTLTPLQPFRLDLTALALVRRSNNAIDLWEDGAYRRVAPVGEAGAGTAPSQVLLEVMDADARRAPTNGAPRALPMTERLLVRATGELPEAELEAAAARLATRLLGLDVDLSGFYAMAEGDEMLRPLVAELRGLKPPRYPGIFQSLLNAVPCQQVTLVFGLQLLCALARTVGPDLSYAPASSPGPLALPDAPALAAADPDLLGSLGFSRSKTRTLQELAAKVVADEIDLAALAQRPNEEVAARLQELYGVGRWTAEYVLLRGLGRLDVFPHGDSGARNGLARFLGEEGKPSYAWVAERTAAWRPYSGFVYVHLLVAGMLRQGGFTPG